MASVVDKFASDLSATLYAVAGLGLRLIVARDVFLAGQAKIAGPAIPIAFLGDGTSVTLPAELRQSTFELFAAKYAALPLSPPLAAYLVSYAEFVLPVCLLVGFATRLSALALLVMAGLVHLYGAPPLWTLPLYLAAMMSVLVAAGPGAISIDAWLRYLYRR